jgi:hypothetical protein
MKFFMLLLLIFLSTANGLALENSTCLKSRDVKALQSQFDWVSKNPKYPKLETCNASDLSFRIANALLYLKGLRFNTSTADISQLNALGQDPYSFFTERVDSIVFEGPESEVCATEQKNGVILWGTHGYATLKDRTMHICEFAGTLSALRIAQFLVHEARHMDGEQFNHVACNHGEYAKTPRFYCDNSLEEGGAYSVGVEFNRKMAKSNLISPALKQQVRNQAIIDLYYRFNRLPLGISEGALLQDEAGTISFFDGIVWQIVKLGSPGNLLVRYWELPMLYSHDGNLPQFIFPGKAEANGWYFEDLFKKILKDSKMTDLLDVYHGPMYSCYLFKTRVQCTSSRDAVFEMNFSSIRPVKLFSTSSFMIAKMNSVFILDQDGILHALPEEISKLPQLNESSLPKTRIPYPSLRLDFWQGQASEKLIFLTPSGELKWVSVKEHKEFSYPLVRDVKFTDMYSPYFYSPKLRDL